MENLENLMIKASALEIFEMFNDSPKEQLELAQLILRCGIRGDEIETNSPMVKMAAKIILRDSYLSRENYKKRCEKNAKYGILGKEYGILGKSMENWEADQEREKPKSNTRRGKGLKMKPLSQRIRTFMLWRTNMPRKGKRKPQKRNLRYGDG